jgi:DNA-binding NtrC family response regulator
LKLVCQDHGIAQKQIEPDAIEALCDINWTGNIRELRNIIERLVILSNNCITAADVQLYANKSH